MKRGTNFVEAAAFLVPLSFVVWGFVALAAAVLRGCGQ
jgi:hypothetical protein